MKVNIRVGQVYKLADEEYLLCRPKKDEASLVSLKSGNRWTDAIIVKNADDITPEEFEKLCGDLDNKQPILVLHSKSKTEMQSEIDDKNQQIDEYRHERYLNVKQIDELLKNNEELKNIIIGNNKMLHLLINKVKV